MIILLLVSVSLKGFKDKYLSLVSMTLIGNEDFGVTNLFIISHNFIFQLVELGSVRANCEQHKYEYQYQCPQSQALLRFHGYFPKNCHGHRALFLLRYHGQFLQTLSLTLLLKNTT